MYILYFSILNIHTRTHKIKSIYFTIFVTNTILS